MIACQGYEPKGAVGTTFMQSSKKNFFVTNLDCLTLQGRLDKANFWYHTSKAPMDSTGQGCIDSKIAEPRLLMKNEKNHTF